MKLWNTDPELSAKIEAFTIGNDQVLDLVLAKYDVQGSLAHAFMLKEVGLLAEDDYPKLKKELLSIYQQILDGHFKIEEGVEDIHSQIELILTQTLGDAGKKIHTGRSRNDQVMVDLHLYYRDELKNLAQEVGRLFDVLIDLSDKHKEVLMPGYTHLQVGMVASFGMWFGAFAENLVDDLRLLLSTYQSVNQNPLGSAAGYGSSFPLKRKITTELLGFEDLKYNSLHAQLGRGKMELYLSFTLNALANTVSKLAMDVCLFSNRNYNFVKLPRELTTGSSIMPHKKNPDVFELIRARCNYCQSLVLQVSAITGNLPSGYHRDFQQLKEIIFPAFKIMKDCLEMLIYALPKMDVNAHILEDPKYRLLYSVEAVNHKVKLGTPFRDAYRQVAESIEAGNFEVPENLSYTHEGSIGNLCNDAVRDKLDCVLAAFPFEQVEAKISALLS